MAIGAEISWLFEIPFLRVHTCWVAKMLACERKIPRISLREHRKLSPGSNRGKLREVALSSTHLQHLQAMPARVAQPVSSSRKSYTAIRFSCIENHLISHWNEIQPSYYRPDAAYKIYESNAVITSWTLPACIRYTLSIECQDQTHSSQWQAFSDCRSRLFHGFRREIKGLNCNTSQTGFKPWRACGRFVEG